MSDLYLLDTNGASDLFSGKSLPHARAALESKARGDVIAISVVTRAELAFGLLKKPEAKRLRLAFKQFLNQTLVLPWDEQAADSYAILPMDLRNRGFVLDTMDLLIAAQAHSRRAKLVTRDNDFRHVAHFVELVDWASY